MIYTNFCKLNNRFLRQIIHLIVLYVLIGCNKPKTQVNNEQLDGFGYHADSMIVPKVFVYETNDSLQRLTFTLRQVKQVNNQKICISVSINCNNQHSSRDSVVSYYKGNSPILKEIFELAWDSVSKTERIFKTKILEDTLIDNKQILKTEYPSIYDPLIVNTCLDIDTVIDKKTLKVFDKDVECYILASLSEQFTGHKLSTLFGRKFKRSKKYIVAKGIGTVYIETINHTFNTIRVTRLKEIIDYDTYLKKYCKN